MHMQKHISDLEMKGRSFVSEHIAPFSGNIAFVVYDCGGLCISTVCMEQIIFIYFMIIQRTSSIQDTPK